jgi:hypothetical protein
MYDIPVTLTRKLFLNKFHDRIIKFQVNGTFKQGDEDHKKYSMILEYKKSLYFFNLTKSIIDMLELYIYDINGIRKCYIYIKPKDMELTISKIVYDFEENEVE